MDERIILKSILDKLIHRVHWQAFVSKVVNLRIHKSRQFHGWVKYHLFKENPVHGVILRLTCVLTAWRCCNHLHSAGSLAFQKLIQLVEFHRDIYNNILVQLKPQITILVSETAKLIHGMSVALLRAAYWQKYADWETTVAVCVSCYQQQTKNQTPSCLVVRFTCFSLH
jgi:hypothetical protein